MTLTERKFKERRSYMLRRLKKYKISRIYYDMIIGLIIENAIFLESVGYCGAGNSSDEDESLSSKCVPDDEAKNFSCFFHDELGRLIKLDKISPFLTKKFFNFSCNFDERTLFDKIKTPFYVMGGTIGLWFQ